LFLVASRIFMRRAFWAGILLLYTTGHKQCARNNHCRRLNVLTS
jgi:hypothetical protein